MYPPQQGAAPIKRISQEDSSGAAPLKPTTVLEHFKAEQSTELRIVAERKLLRTLPKIGRVVVDFSSNDYLGLSGHPRVKEAAKRAVEKWGAGSGASRLLSGNLGIHGELERALARFKKEQCALVFSAGYLANLGVVTALLDERDVVLVDRLNHASLIDAARLSGAKLWVYPHLDLGRLKDLLARAASFRRRLVVTDAYFSMDGHVAPLDRMLELCEAHQALLMIDEAHSTGVFGRTGRGLTEHFGLSGKIPVVMGTLSKALGASGGYVAGSNTLIQTLVNRAKPFIYTTAPVPAASAAALESIRLLQRFAGAIHEPALLQKLRQRTRQLREGLEGLGLDLMGSEGPIIPIRIGDAGRTLRLRQALVRRGFEVGAIRPPTVPKGPDRIRLSVSAQHTPDQIRRFLHEFEKVWRRP